MTNESISSFVLRLRELANSKGQAHGMLVFPDAEIEIVAKRSKQRYTGKKFDLLVVDEFVRVMEKGR